MNAALLAHQGGWDEALLVAVPVAFIFVVLWFAKRKAERIGNDDARGPGATGAETNAASTDSAAS